MPAAPRQPSDRLVRPLRHRMSGGQDDVRTDEYDGYDRVADDTDEFLDRSGPAPRPHPPAWSRPQRPQPPIRRPAEMYATSNDPARLRSQYHPSEDPPAYPYDGYAEREFHDGGDYAEVGSHASFDSYASFDAPARPVHLPAGRQPVSRSGAPRLSPRTTGFERRSPREAYIDDAYRGTGRNDRLLDDESGAGFAGFAEDPGRPTFGIRAVIVSLIVLVLIGLAAQRLATPGEQNTQLNQTSIATETGEADVPGAGNGTGITGTGITGTGGPAEGEVTGVTGAGAISGTGGTAATSGVINGTGDAAGTSGQAGTSGTTVCPADTNATYPPNSEPGPGSAPARSTATDASVSRF